MGLPMSRCEWLQAMALINARLRWVKTGRCLLPDTLSTDRGKVEWNIYRRSCHKTVSQKWPVYFHHLCERVDEISKV
jgi:hypothetical protein